MEVKGTKKGQKMKRKRGSRKEEAGRTAWRLAA